MIFNDVTFKTFEPGHVLVGDDGYIRYLTFQGEHGENPSLWMVHGAYWSSWEWSDDLNKMHRYACFPLPEDQTMPPQWIDMSHHSWESVTWED